MTETEESGPDYRSEPSYLLFRVVAFAALGLSVGSGGYTLSTTDDRIRKAEVEQALRVRDVEIRHLHEQYRELKAQVERIDSLGPAVGNRDFERRISRLEDRIDK